MSKLEWNGEGAKDHVNGRAVKFLSRAAIEVKRKAQVLLSVPGTGGGRDTKGRFVRVYGANPSKPGQPPHKQTGHLRRSVTYEVDRKTLTARVGTNVEYGKHLELGTKRGLAPRPWLRPALASVAARVNELLGQIGSEK